MLRRLGFPDVGPHRRFVSAMGIDALGSGVWMPLSMLYFLHQTSLSLVQLGLAMTVANAAVIPAVPLLGSLVDRVGPRRVMQIGNVGAASAFVLYPFAHSLAVVTLLVFVSTLTRSAFWSALGPMVTQITEPGERELWFGFLQAMRNAGYGVGGVLAAVALTLGSNTAYQSVVLANAASYVVAFVLMLGVRGGHRPAPQAPQERVPGAPVLPGGPWVAFGDPAYRILVAVSFCYALVQATLNVAMPVYVVDTLSLPGWVSGAVFVTNTVMVGLGQGLVVRAMTGAVRARVLHLAVACSAVSFAVLYAAAVSAPSGVVAVLIGVVVFTLGELTAGPVVAALSAEAAPAAAAGRYMAAVQLARVTSYAVAPLLYAAMLDRGPLTMWGGALVLCVVWAALVVALGVRMPLACEPVTNLAEVDALAGPGPGGFAGGARDMGAPDQGAVSERLARFMFDLQADDYAADDAMRELAWADDNVHDFWLGQAGAVVSFLGLERPGHPAIRVPDAEGHGVSGAVDCT